MSGARANGEAVRLAGGRAAASGAGASGGRLP